MKKIIILALAIYSGILVSSEDNDKNPTCPYLLEYGERCEDKTFEILKGKKKDKDEEEDEDNYESVPEPEGLLALGIVCLMLSRLKKS